MKRFASGFVFVMAGALALSAAAAMAAEKVERAIALSRETYCSVWHSLQPDIDFQTGFEIRA